MGRCVCHEPRPDEAHRRAIRRDDREDQGGAVKKDQALLPLSGEGRLLLCLNGVYQALLAKKRQMEYNQNMKMRPYGF